MRSFSANYSLHQHGSVDDYTTEFVAIMDQLLAYDKSHGPLYFAMKYIDGLRADIRAVVLLQRPSDVDTAVLLARLQEEVADPTKPKAMARLSAPTYSKPALKPGYPIPPPPERFAMQKQEDRKNMAPPVQRQVPDKWSALKTYRRARGLCDRCGEKWSRGHRCPDSVQLHVLKEVLDLFQLESDAISEQGADEVSSQLCLTLSVAAVSGVSSPRTMRLHGYIQKLPVQVLVDSGSSHTFISPQLASKLHGVTLMPDPMTVRVANGNTLHCTTHIPAAIWFLDSVQFQSDLKVLPLSTYDMILGLDWLEKYSPMKVHWGQQWISFAYQGSTVLIQGSDAAVLPPDTVIELCQVTSVVSEVQRFPADIQALLDQYADLFEIPTSLPPRRQCDHSIPLVEGAAPVQIRPYRYTPALKLEIEKQIQEMLDSGFIQKSSSPFASSVLLVRKKDNTWRFCVDYRYLNAITLKAKYPVPVIDELLDELAKSKWFSKLDLRAGFHQIRMKEGEEYKTAFQTHCGHYEFCWHELDCKHGIELPEGSLAKRGRLDCILLQNQDHTIQG